jgi:hypothetical protein
MISPYKLFRVITTLHLAQVVQLVLLKPQLPILIVNVPTGELVPMLVSLKTLGYLLLFHGLLVEAIRS